MLTEQQLHVIKARTALQLFREHINSFVGLKKKAIELINEATSNMGIKLTDKEVDDLAWSVVEKIKLSPDIGISVKSSQIRKDNWLDKADFKFNYFSRFEKYLQLRKGWINIDALKTDSYSIIQMLGDPKSAQNCNRRGLIIGDVQSGKTASYTAIMNRAVDVGYDVIVLLAGSLENLRRQTQKRIDKELVGYTLNQDDWKTNDSIGVGEFKIPEHLQVQTNVKKDFTSTTRSKTLSRIEGRTILFVAKKNVKTLAEILDALKTDNEDALIDNDKIDASILVIDDEADNASVNTKKNANLDPTSINGGIRKLLKAFRKSSYLAVTATPFANIYIDDTTESEMYGDDLFPSDFIHLLDRPAAYSGALELFSDYVPDLSSSSSSTLIPVSEKEIPQASFRFRHKKEDVKIEKYDDLPGSLKKAIRYFLLVQYLMDFLPNIELPHRTMMINVSRFVDIQNTIAKVIELWMKETFLPSIFQWHNYPDASDNPNSGEFHELKLVWDEFELEYLSGVKWEDVCVGLYDSVCEVRVASENMSSESKIRGRLNYEKYPKGDRVIAVGGQCLSRGLTLENLVVSYFYRNSAAYDTLLQMGRWFGYRDSYFQYFKIWMADDSILWYRLISDACEDLRSQIESMNTLEMEPRDFGLMVRRHPYSGLIITARCKMRKSEKSSKHPVDLNGRLIESPRLWKSKELNQKNELRINTFLSLIQNCQYDSNGNLIMKNVAKADIYSLVASFDSALLSIGFKVSQLSEYILKNTGMLWDVCIPGNGGGSPVDLSVGDKHFTVRTVCRKYKDDGMLDDGKPFIKVNDHHVRIGQGNITRIGLTDRQIADLKKRYNSEQHEKSWEKIKNTASIYLQAYEEGTKIFRNPLLILYPLQLNDIDRLNEPPSYNLIWGMGIGFPGVKGADRDRYYEYWLNPVAIRKGVGIAKDQEEEDDVDVAE